ncbi:MAG: flagellar biosynthesis protein FlhF [Phycisphaeraceae bacterium]|nr:flagellar biosynthesis protein FlhF [Phycisphaeraceae bacterium]
MNLRTYQAYTMAEALGAVKRELGADAVILGTRTFRRRSAMWMLGFGGRTIVEVTAAAATEVRSLPARPARPAGAAVPPPPPLQPPLQPPDQPPLQPPLQPPDPALVPRRASARAAYGAVAGGAGPDAGALARERLADGVRAAPAASAKGASSGSPAHTPGDPGADPAVDRERTRRLAQSMLERYEREGRVPRGASAPVGTATAVASAAEGKRPGAEDRSTPRRFVLKTMGGDDDPGTGAGIRPGATARMNGSAATGPASIDRVAEHLQGEIASLRSLVTQVLARDRGHGADGPAPAYPPRLFEWYTRLIAREMSKELADRIIRDVAGDLGAADLDQPDRVRAALRRRIMAYLPATGEGSAPHAEALGRMAPSPRGDRDRPWVVALVGPTGVGKTTTVAKLAAAWKLRHGLRVGLITCDTYRIGAIDQLRTYAGIIGADLRVAMSPDDVHEAVLAMDDCDAILVDTAGRSQNDELRIGELAALVAAAAPDETHLVLSATARESVLLREAEAFGRVGIDRVLLTKLDESVGFGMLVEVIHRLGTRLSFFSTGQEVPSHLEPADPGRLADLLVADVQVPPPCQSHLRPLSPEHA